MSPGDPCKMSAAMSIRAAVLALLAGLPLIASGAETEDVVPSLPLDPVKECLSGNPTVRSSVQTVVVRARDRIGSERTLRANVYWKRFDDGFSRLLASFKEPEDINGAGFLLIEQEGANQMFLYMPELRKIRRVNSQMMKGKIFGTDFSYEDFARLQGVVGEEDLQRRPDSELDGRPVYVIEGRAPPEAGSAYEFARMFIDKERCVPVKTELYERGGTLRKVLTAREESISREGGLWIPRELLMRDVRDQTETTLMIESIEIGKSISDRVFSLGQLERVERR